MPPSLCDTNVWLALTLSEHLHHRVARDWLQTVRETDQVMFCRASQQSFLRLLTNKAVMAHQGIDPLSNQQAWAAYDAFLEDDRIVLRADEPEGLEHWWRQFATRGTASPGLWMDAYLAAFAIAARCTFVTTDAAFRQFDGLDLFLLGRAPSL